MKKLGFISVLIVISMCMCVLFAGCTPETNAPAVNPSDDVEIPDNPTEEQPEGTNPEEVTDNTEQNTTPYVPEFINKLTGLETTEELADNRPVAIMINNIKKATPQQGISHADIVYEVLAEGGITRLLCLFNDYASLPETGSVRSARDYYIDLSDAHDAIYVHCGTSPMADEVLSARKTNNMNGIYFSTPFYRNQWRLQNMGTEHSLMTTGELLVKGIEKKGYRTESDAKQPLTFALEEQPVDEQATKADYAKLKYSYYATSEFDYDSENGVYLKSQYNDKHIDSNNDTQLSFENVIILYCEQGMVPGDDAGRLWVDFTGDGEGYYMSNGVVKGIKWHKDTRTSIYTLYEQDGQTELVLNPGKSYIGIAPIDAETVFE